MPDYSTPPRLVHSRDTIPQVFLVAPPLAYRFPLNLHREARIFTLCQGPSFTNGPDPFHMTAHRGYTIKYPRDLEHRHRVGIKRLAKMSGLILRGVVTIARLVSNFPIPSGTLAASPLSSIHRKADNRALLNRAGVDPDSLFSVQIVTDDHQMMAMEELFRVAAASTGQHNITGDLNGLVLEDGRTIWVCDRCYRCLRRGDPIEETNQLTLSQYIPLVKKESEVKVTLCNSTSVILLTESLTGPAKTNKLLMRIESEYFEAPERAIGTRFNSIVDLFNNLGQVLQLQKVLTHLDINGNSANGVAYAGLNAMLKCRSLETLRISGIPCFLQCENITVKCRRLKELSLQHVLLNTKQATDNLWALIGVCPDLVRLKVTQAGFASNTLSLAKPKETLTQFARLEYLDLSGNDFGAQEATDFVRMALARDNPKLRCLDLSGNPRIGDSGCHGVLELLWRKKCLLERLKLEDTGCKDPRTSQCVCTYLSHCTRPGQRYEL